MIDSITGPIAQRLEQQTHNLLVPGSNPGGPTKSHRINETLTNDHAATPFFVTLCNNWPATAASGCS